MQEQLISFPRNQLSLFIRSMSSDPAESPQKSGWGSKVARQYFAFSIGSCAALIHVPLLVVFIDRWLSSAAPWRFRRQRHIHARERLAERCYGWTRKNHVTHMGQNWKDMRDVISCMLHWRYRIKNYDWWFWDPDGSGAKPYEDRRNCLVLRRFLKWTQSREYRAETLTGRTCDLEQGRPTISACSAPIICATL